MSAVVAAIALWLGMIAAPVAHAQTLTSLYQFCEETGCADGAEPSAGLVMDSKGILYGTTVSGGDYTGANCSSAPCGTVFRLESGKEKVLYKFKGGSDGANPTSSLILDTAGNLYGTTEGGGAGSCTEGLINGCGTVFKLTGTTEKVLYAFKGGTDGRLPEAGLVMDKKGDLYGTTNGGGTGTGCGSSGCGTIFKVTGTTEKVLYTFEGGTDGANPGYGNLILDTKGNLYGTTELGGKSGFGTVFKLSASGTKTVLYSFTGGTDGYEPYGGLVMDVAGNLYGTTRFGGEHSFGTIFKLTASGTKTVLYSFQGSPDGEYPSASLVKDTAGNLYGTTGLGGILYGTVFELNTSNVESVLWTFDAGTDGANPVGALILDKAGNLYGTAGGGGLYGGGEGTAFEITP